MAEIDDFLSSRDLLLRLREDQDAACREFGWPKLARFNWALDYFDRMAAGNDRPALWLVDESGAETKLSFADLARRSNQVANHLRALGVRRGDPILLMLGNVAPLWETMLAAMKLGAVLIPSTTLLGRDDLIDRVTRGGVRHVIAAAEETGKFEDVPGSYGRIVVGGEAAGWSRFEDAYGADASFTPEGETATDDPLLLYFTSGTTAKAKLVLHTHQSYPVGHLSTMYWLGLRPGDVHLNISSPGWAKHAWSCFFAPWNAGATVFVYTAKRFSAKDVLSTIVRHGVTTLCAPPTVWRLFAQEDLPAYEVKLTSAVSAGEPLNPEIIEVVRRAWGIEIRDGYGQTETTAQIGNPPGQRIRPGSMGRALPGYRVLLLDPYGRETEEGEVALDLRDRPLGLMPGYLDDPQRTEATMAGGHYRTGDVARRDADGYITFVGRADDVFKAADYRISPFELESVLIEHDAVAEAAVVPSPDPIRLAVPKAYIALAAGWTPDADTARAVFRHCREHLAPFKRVRRLEFADLPKTISGKIRRVDLRRREDERHAAATAPRGKAEFWEEDFPELRS
ncbi:MAG: AMP-dependent synthetase [Alphaproteobacteria bacterium]|nr:MAG: AMP-dependent synthetase [Alphaproteobacteria bacterium]